jgi:hypothetical protein
VPIDRGQRQRGFARIEGVPVAAERSEGTADGRALFKNGDLVTEIGELYTGRQTGDARSDDDNPRHSGEPNHRGERTDVRC